MTRKKVKLAFITNDSSRKATYKKRKKGLMKKVDELTALCGIDACAIVYSPYDSHPEVWPSTVGAQNVVSRFKNMPEMEQSKKMVNQEGFVKQRITKVSGQLKKQRRENWEKEMTEVLYQTLAGKGLNGLSIMDLKDLDWVIDQNLRELNKRCDSLTNSSSSSEVSAPPLALLPPPPPPPPPLAPTEPMWFTDLLNGHNQQMGFPNEEMMMMVPYAEDNNNHFWPNSNGFFP